MKRTFLRPAAFPLLAAALAACGEGDSDSNARGPSARASNPECPPPGAAGTGDSSVTCGSASGGSGGLGNPDAGAGPTGQTCATPLPTTLQAETAMHTGVEVASEVQGFEGKGYVAEFGDVGDRVTFDVCVPEGGYYTLNFRYAKGESQVATRTIVVDGQEFAAPPAFPPEWSWENWAQGGRRSLHLEAGDHQIALAFTGADVGEIRLDEMTISPGPMPSEISVRALLMNDWEDLVVGWHAAELYPADDDGFGPHMTMLHSRIDWPTNQLDQAQAYFRDVTAGFAYDRPNEMGSRNYFAASEEQGYGELIAEYGPYDDQALPLDIVRRQIVPPGEDGIVVVYELQNSTGGAREMALLEWADWHNKTTGPSEDPGDTGTPSPAGGTLKAEWHAAANAWIVDMTQTNGTAAVLGALQPMDRHVAGQPVSGGPDRTASTVQTFFGDPGSLSSTESFENADVGVGLAKTVRVEPGAQASLAFFYGVADSVQAARSLAEQLHGSSAEQVAERASSAWKGWLDSGKASTEELLDAEVAAWGDALRTAMLTIRQSQQPEFGSFVAATNPAYFYSVWPRDAAVTAIGLDAAGYLDAAEKYWRWMAQAQADGSNPDFPEGTWWTNYGYWSPSRGIPFVSPEWDSLGLFLSGVYHHYQSLQAVDSERASQFLSDVWPEVRNSANFIQQGANDPSNHGFGPEDYSIWEENLAFHTFTQTTYVAGLQAAAQLAFARGESASGWVNAAQSIRDAIFRPTSAEPCPGLWESDLNYFVRSVLPDCTANRTVDAASDLLWVLGVLSPDNPRAMQHREAILANLTPSDWGHGISRYEGDTFYYSSEFNPGGQYEALAPMPTWPQMASYMAMLEYWRGMDDLVENRLSWYVATAPYGFVPHGEAVDWSTQRPLISTAAEPVTGAWFSLALLTRLGEFDMRIPPPSGTGSGADAGAPGPR